MIIFYLNIFKLEYCSKISIKINSIRYLPDHKSVLPAYSIKGCECPVCPLAQSLDIGIERNSYCINGSEIEQRG